MDRRPELQSVLEQVLGAANVYFQPPPNLVMVYPCIVYEHDQTNTDFASNVPYRLTKRWQVTHIDKSSLSPVPDKIAKLPMTTFSRRFVSDNLNHNIFNVFF